MIMEKNDWANVSIENALDGLSMEEIERLEAYYMAEAECLMAFGGQEKKEPLTFMLKHLRATECLFKTLQFPWEESVEHSPLKYANMAKTPTLFIQSDEDYRCWMGDAIQMFSALKYFGGEARMCLFHGENHELSRSGKPKHRIRRMTEMMEWFDKYLK